MATLEEEAYFSVLEAARLLKVSPATVWRWIAAGQLAAHRIGPRTIRIDGEALASLRRPARATQEAAAGKVSAPEPKSKRLKEKLLSLAGAWHDLDAESLIEEIYRARHEAPPSPVPL